MCRGCVFWNSGLKLVARCWYSSCSFIVIGIKYVVYRLLCAVG